MRYAFTAQEKEAMRGIDPRERAEGCMGYGWASNQGGLATN